MNLLVLSIAFAPNHKRSNFNWSFNLKTCCAVLASAAFTAVFTGPANAQSWSGNTSTDWTVGSNWGGGLAPTSATNASINISSPHPSVLGVNGSAVGATANLVIGNSGPASLTIQSGSTLTTSGAAARIGQGAGSVGTLTVTGSGSSWIITTAPVFISNSGTGTLNIDNGGLVSARNGLRVGGLAGSSGTLNVSSGGILETTSLVRGVAGTALANFDEGILRARASNANFITGFAAGELNLAAGGLTVDTAGFTVGTDATSGFSGAGGLTVTGGGTFDVASINSYASDTQIDAGSTLALTGVGSIAASDRVVTNGTFDISGLTGNGTDIQSLAGSGDVVLGAKDLTITNANDLFSGVISGSGGLTLSGGTETFSGANDYTGATTVAGGVLRAGAANTFSSASAFSVLSGGTLDLAGFDQTLASLGNAGTVNLGGAPGTVLTVAGNYVGNGGTLQINSTLGGDGSPTDLLRVQGTTSGSTLLRVNNVGGTGAQTVNGIEVIDVTGTSAGSFALQGDYIFKGEQAVIAGAYAYTLQQNGISTADGDWYLRSSLINPPLSTPAGPLYAPTVPIYEVYSQVLLGLNDLPTLQQRVGNRYWDGAARSNSSTASASEIWARIEGRHSDYNADHSTTGASYDADEFKLQSGLDGLVVDNAAGRLIGGMNFQYGTSSADVQSFYGDGHIHAEGYGLGGTLTWYGRSGFYVDGQARATWFNNDLRSDLVGDLKDGNGAFGYAFSVETGQRVPVGAAWALIPQAQLAYSNVNFNSFTDPFGARVSSNDGDSLDGRLGLALENGNAWRDASGAIARSSVYGIANLYYEFLNGTGATVSGTDIGTDGERLWGGLGVGGSYSWADDKYSVYGEVLANTSLESFGDSDNYSATGGIRMKW